MDHELPRIGDEGDDWIVVSKVGLKEKLDRLNALEAAALGRRRRRALSPLAWLKERYGL